MINSFRGKYRFLSNFQPCLGENHLGKLLMKIRSELQGE